MQANKAKSSNHDNNSLAIIEECLDRIYLSRRANLLTKARKFKERQARKLQSLPHQHRATQQKEDASVLDNYSDNQILEELDMKFKAPPLVAAAVVMVEKKEVPKVNYDEQDSSAMEILREFCDELTLITEDSPMRIPDDDFRGEHCDALIHKYLTSELDKMMATRTVSKVRKHLAGIIEQFAASEDVGKLNKLMEAAIKDCHSSPTAAYRQQQALPKVQNDTPSTAPAAGKNKAAPEPQADQAASLPNIASKTNSNTAPLKSALKQTSAPEATANNNNNPNTTATKSAADPSADKAKVEKQRIKAQYEQLMALKKKTENHPDDTAIDQYSALHADIQSVIDSIQQRPAAPAETKTTRKGAK